MARVVMNRIPDSVYIGRAGRGEDGYFGNLYHACATCARCKQEHWSGGSTLACYEDYLNERAGFDPEFKQRVEELRGRFLWCPGGCKRKRLPCHGDVLTAYANGEKQWRTT